MPAETTTAPIDVRDLIGLAIAGLRTMQLDSQLFCLEHRRAAGPEGRSLRYSLMVYLGLLRAERAGYDHGFDLEAIWNALLGEVDDDTLTAGDLGLYVWADARTDRSRSEELLDRLTRRLDVRGGLARCVGMEVAWIVQGAALAGDPARDTGHPVLPTGIELLVEGNRAASGLFYHSGSGAFRRRFPNFATQIYSILALTTVAQLRTDERVLGVAKTAADRVIAHQRPDGGWPWLFDADRDQVVEPYEVYSVHQHAMAPMGLLELAGAAEDDRYAAAAVRGLPWIRGRNELALDMVDSDEQIILRSIRRRPWVSRLCLYGNVAAALALGRPVYTGGAVLELNATCRPYELGWLLEAWCGREHMADGAAWPSEQA